MAIQLFFFPFFILLLMLALSEQFLVADISLSLLFYLVFEWSYRYIDDIFNASESSSSLTHIDCLYHLLDIRPYASSRVFSFSSPFAEVFSSSTLRIVPSILQDLVSNIFLVFTRYYFLIFTFISVYLMVNRFQHSQIFVSFLFFERSDFFLIRLFYSFRIYRLPLFIMSMAHFSMPKSLYVVTAYPHWLFYTFLFFFFF